MNIANKLFKIYKSPASPQITSSHEDYFKIIISNYFYINEKVALDKEEIFSSIDFEINEYNDSIYVTGISIKSPYKSIILDILIVNNSGGGDVLIGISSTYPKVLLQILEELNTKSIIDVYPRIVDILNEFAQIMLAQEVRAKDTSQQDLHQSIEIQQTQTQTFGNMELVYNIKNRHLHEISINLPENDFQHLSTNFIHDFYSFMYDKTKLNFNNLEMVKFISNNLILLDGRFKIIKYNEFVVLKCIHRAINIS